MTRALLALAAAAAAVSACAGIPASTPWVVQPTNPPACAPPAEGKSCFDRPLVPPVVVGPGRIQVVTRTGLTPPPGYDPMRPVSNQFRFFIEEITRAGHQPVADGNCPGKLSMSNVASLLRTPSGESAVVCLEARNRDGCVEPPHRICSEEEQVCPRETEPCLTGYAHFGVVDRARHTIDWRWRTEVGLPPVLHEDRVQVVAFGDGAAILYEGSSYPPWNHESGWAVVPMPAGDAFAVDDEGRGEWLAAALVADGNLHLILGQAGSEGRYRQLTITKHGARSSRRLDQAGPLTPGRPGRHCLAEGADGTVTVSLAYRKDDDYDYDYDYETWRDTPASTLTLRYRNAFLPKGPDVYPSARAACAPRIAAAADARWVRATFDDQGVLIVYTILESDGRNGSLYVERRAR